MYICMYILSIHCCCGLHKQMTRKGDEPKYTISTVNLSLTNKKPSKLHSDDTSGLQDFVKISKWNDVSFWSIKQSVEKTHR